MSTRRARETTDFDVAPLDECVEAATGILGTGEVDEAIEIWEKLRRRFPDSAEVKLGTAVALKRLQRLSEAEKLLAEAVLQHPAHERLLVEWAELAHNARSWLEAEPRWERVRASFPSMEAGYTGGGVALRELRRFDEADQVYRQAFNRFPITEQLMRDFAWVAHHRHDWAEARRRWQAFRTAFPRLPDGYLLVGVTFANERLLDEADAELIDALRHFPGHREATIAFAWVATHRRDWPEALRRWGDVSSQFHGIPDGFRGATQALMEIGRLDDANAIIAPALRMFPDDPQLALLNCRLAALNSDWTEAERRWLAFATRFPNVVDGYIGAADAMTRVKNFEQARSVLLDAALRFPQNDEISIALAQNAQQCSDFPEAIRLWKLAIDRSPNSARLHCGLLFALADAARNDELDECLQLAMNRFPTDLEVSSTRATIASRQKDWKSAECLWRDIAEQQPTDARSQAHLGESLRELGRLEESLDILNKATLRLPFDREIERNLALTLSRKRNWPVALKLWESLKQRYPNDAAISSNVIDVLWQARMDLGAKSLDGDSPSDFFEIPDILLSDKLSREGERAATKEMLSRFESIGDTCEFGIVQRRFGAEPLSLLRWASTPPGLLVDALNNKFHGVGSSEHTVLGVINGEYTTSDKRYHMFSHTFTRETAEPKERFFLQQCRRMQFLRRKFLDDLAAGEKIFVYKSDGGLTNGQIGALHDAISRYGNRTILLCVRLADAENPAGTLQSVSKTLFIGHIDKFSNVDISFDTWLHLCRSVIKELETTDTSLIGKP